MQGAEAPLSGLIALLAAAEILGNSTLAPGYQRRLVFAAFAGEPWGYMGSKRFLWELHMGENSTQPLSLEAIDQARSHLLSQQTTSPWAGAFDTMSVGTGGSLWGHMEWGLYSRAVSYGS